jgi:ubiquinone/menaquinone biosynthesis C-methylase UbiE
MKTNGFGIGFFKSGLYDKARKKYSKGLIFEINKLFGSLSGMISAEFGAGSGLFTRILTESDLDIDTLYIVEPDIRGIVLHKKGFRGVSRKKNPVRNLCYVRAGSDASLLPGQSIDNIFAAQCFHFFVASKTRQEFIRILKPSGRVFILGRFLLPVNETTAKYIELTRFGKRWGGIKNNIEAYSEKNITAFYGHPVEKKTVVYENRKLSLGDLNKSIRIRIDASGDDFLKNNPGEIKTILNKTRDFYSQYHIHRRVELIYETFYFCGSLT